MATVPLSGTDISFYTGIPFSNDYKHTRWFDNITEQLAWFSSKTVVHQMSQTTFQRFEQRTFVSVNKSIDELRNVNYMKFRNATLNKWFYAFVTELEYRNTNVTRVHFQIDVLQTYRFDWNFQPSYIDREHRPQYYSDGRPVINTIDEGLDYGTEYDTVWVRKVVPNQHKFLVIVTKTQMHDLPEPGNPNKGKIIPRVIGITQPLSYYIIPFQDDDTVPNVVLPNGQAPLLSKPSEVLKGVYTDTDAVNNVVSIFVTDYTGISCSYNSSDNVMTFSQGNNLQAVQVSNGEAGFFNCIYVEKVKNFAPFSITVDDKYNGYSPVQESKLLMYPYTVLVMDDFKGNRVEFKNEYIDRNQIDLMVKGSLGTSNKVSYSIQDYKFKFTTETLKQEVADEHALINSDPNDVPIITDMLSAFLQGNKNQLATQKDAAFFGGAMGVANSAVSIASSPTPAGIASGAVGGVQALGDAFFQIKAQNSKIADIKNVPPSLTKMGSNTAYSFGNEYDGVYVMKKQIKAEHRNRLTQFFKMFGYKTNEIKVPNFHTRRSWNYVKTVGCYIRGNFNNEDLQEIKNIFDRGITLWHHEDMGNYELDNSEV